MLSYFHAKCCPSILFLPLQRELYIPPSTILFPIRLTTKPNPKKEKMQKVSPCLISSLLCSLSKRYLLRLSNDGRIYENYFSLWSYLLFNKKQVKQKYNLIIESLLPNNISNRYTLIVTPTREKNLWPPSQK